MQLVWHDRNLWAHAAKHFLGDADEAWHELIPSHQQDHYSDWTDRQTRSECDTENHADNCPNPSICSSAVCEAAQPYRDAVAARWTIAMTQGFWVQAPSKNVLHTYAVGPDGVFMVAGHEDARHVRARTAFRVDPTKHTRVAAAFKKMRSYRPRRGAGMSERDLVQLETALLGLPTSDPTVQRRVNALTQRLT